MDLSFGGSTNRIDQKEGKRDLNLNFLGHRFCNRLFKIYISNTKKFFLDISKKPSKRVLETKYIGCSTKRILSKRF